MQEGTRSLLLQTVQSLGSPLPVGGNKTAFHISYCPSPIPEHRNPRRVGEGLARGLGLDQCKGLGGTESLP